MSKKVLSSYDLRLNPLENLVLEKLGSDPTPTEGRVWYNTSSDSIKFSDGTSIFEIGGQNGGWSSETLVSPSPVFPTNGNNLLTLNLTANTVLGNPVSVANEGLYILHVVQDGTGGHTLTFDTNFLAVDSLSINSSANSRTSFLLFKLGSTGSIFVKQLTILNSAASAGTYGNAANIPSISIDAKGKVTNASQNPLIAQNVGSTLAPINYTPTSADVRGHLEGIDTALASAIQGLPVGTLVFKGGWNATSNSPDLTDVGNQDVGSVYRVSVAGSTLLDGINSWLVGDLVYRDTANVWRRKSEPRVTSVFNRTGTISAAFGDYTDSLVRVNLTPTNYTSVGLTLNEHLAGIDNKLGTLEGQVGSGTTNLGIANRTANQLTVTSDTGNDAVIPAATTSLAGLMTASDKSILNSLNSLAPSLTLGVNTATTLGVDISGGGSSVTLPSATLTTAGLFSAADKNTLTTLQAGSSPTNLSLGIIDDISIEIDNDSGLNVVLPQANEAEAGLLSAIDKEFLNNLGVLFPSREEDLGDFALPYIDKSRNVKGALEDLSSNLTLSQQINILLEEEWPEVNGTVIDGKAPVVGNNWEKWFVASSAGVITSNSGRADTTITGLVSDLGVQQYLISGNLNYGSITGEVGLVVRADISHNGILFRLKSDFLEIVEVTAGVENILSSVAVTLEDNSAHNISVVVKTDRIYYSLDQGNYNGSFASTTFNSNTRAGFYLSANTNFYVSRFYSYISNFAINDAASITGGTLDNNRLSTDVTLQGNTFNGANQLVQLLGDGSLPALDGSNLTNLGGGNVYSTQTMTGNITINTQTPNRVFLDPDGTDRDVTLSLPNQTEILLYHGGTANTITLLEGVTPIATLQAGDRADIIKDSSDTYVYIH